MNVVVSRKLSRKVELTGAWVFASGNHISLPEYKYLSPIYQKENGYAGVDSYRPMNSGLSARNNYQLSPYHRLDLGVNFYRYKKKGRMGIWNISVFETESLHDGGYGKPGYKSAISGGATGDDFVLLHALSFLYL